MNPISLRARWVVPVTSPPIDGGVVTIVGDRIAAVGKRADGPVVDLGDVAILPGFVNAHTHLELSDCAAPLGQPKMPFADWIRLVPAHRAARTTTAWAAIEQGLAESLDSGVTTIGDIDNANWSATQRPRTQLDVTVFLELLALGGDRLIARQSAADSFAAAPWSDIHAQPGLSPHAPYTVHPDLLARAVAISRRGKIPLAMHLAESREEIEFLRTLGGPLRTMLDEFEMPVESVLSSNRRPLDYLRTLADAHRALIIHGNYLTDDEIAFLAEHRDTMSVVYCPRTHEFFGHDAHPLEKLLAAGVTVALGTDSRASNPNLDLLAEMRFIAESYPRISPATVLELGTLAGARALGLECECGSIDVGKLANLTAISLLRNAERDPCTMILDPAPRVLQVWHRGTLSLRTQGVPGAG